MLYRLVFKIRVLYLDLFCPWYVKLKFFVFVCSPSYPTKTRQHKRYKTKKLIY